MVQCIQKNENGNKIHFVHIDIGNIFAYLLEKLWWFLRTVTDEYYPILKIWCGFTPVVSIRHPDDLEVCK